MDIYWWEVLVEESHEGTCQQSVWHYNTRFIITPVEIAIKVQTQLQEMDTFLMMAVNGVGGHCDNYEPPRGPSPLIYLDNNRL